MDRHYRSTTTTRADGDFAVDGDPSALAARRAAVVPYAWTWLRQVHGGRVVVVDQPGVHAGDEADAAVATVSGAAVAVQSADCAPLILVGDGVVGVAHVGWRGLMAGVVENTVATMREHGDIAVATVGPSIGPECYEFGPDDLDAIAGRYGDSVRGITSVGAPALDLYAGITVALRGFGVDPVRRPPCTACDAGRYFSHRARGEAERMATVAWLEA